MKVTDAFWTRQFATDVERDFIYEFLYRQSFVPYVIMTVIVSNEYLAVW